MAIDVEHTGFGVRAGTASATVAPDAEQPARAASLARHFRFLTSSLTRRILAINLLVLAVPVGGFFFLGQYQQSLIDQKIEALRVQGEVFAGAIGSSAVVNTPGVGQRLERARSAELLRRLTAPTSTRARLFSSEGDLLSDTRALAAPRGLVRIKELPPPQAERPLLSLVTELFDSAVNWLPGRTELPPYRELPVQSAADYAEVEWALFGQGMAAVRDDTVGGMVISVAVPVQRYKQVLGALMLSADSTEIEAGLRAVRISILRVFVVALGVTVLLSMYLAGTIGRPLRRLAAAAEQVRRGHGRQAEIPDLNRGDEIGDLSRDLRGMTTALWDRMDAIERFAADVAHEIKNPLTSLRSAVETTARVTDPDQQRRLMSIILEDVQRLDRLISDISDASRIDAELSRLAPEPVELQHLLSALVEVSQATAQEGRPRLKLDIPPGLDLTVRGLGGRLGQVFQNIIGNALSFSPDGTSITCRAWRQDDLVWVAIEDEGPGIHPNKLEGIFDRFYSDRPDGQAGGFGKHSGLGLSISRQIVQAVGGRIWAENRQDAAGRVLGARFVVELPAMKMPARARTARAQATPGSTLPSM